MKPASVFLAGAAFICLSLIAETATRSGRRI